MRSSAEQKKTSVSNFFQTVLVNIYVIGVRNTSLSDDACAEVDKLLDVAFFKRRRSSPLKAQLRLRRTGGISLVLKVQFMSCFDD